MLDWFGLHEELAIGGDFTRVRGVQALQTYTAFGPVLFDVLTFDPDAYPDPRASGRPDITTDARAVLEQYGAFISLRVDLNDAWSVTGGARVATDRLDLAGRILFSGVELPNLSNLLSQLGSNRVVTPYAALLYRLNERYYLSQDTPQMNVWYGEPRNFMLRVEASY